MAIKNTVSSRQMGIETLFPAIFDLRSSIFKSFVDCCLSGVLKVLRFILLKNVKTIVGILTIISRKKVQE